MLNHKIILFKSEKSVYLSLCINWEKLVVYSFAIAILDVFFKTKSKCYSRQMRNQDQNKKKLKRKKTTLFEV